MSAKDRPLRPVEGALIVVIVMIIAGFAMYAFRLRPMQNELRAAREYAPQMPAEDGGMAEEARASIERQEAELRRQWTEKEKRLTQLASRFAPEAQGVQEQAVAISDLAVRCGLKVHESNFPYRPDSTDGSGGFNAMFLARYPGEVQGCRRPLLRMVAEAPYAGVSSFTEALAGLNKRATIVRFQLERRQRVPDVRRSVRNAHTSDASLVLTFLIAL